MKRKVLIRKKVYEEVNVELAVYDNLTLVLGDSGTGKTLVFSALHDSESINSKSKFRFFNIYNSNEIQSIKTMRNKVIMVDNADLFLDDDIREFIAQDRNNYYILFGRDNRYLNTGPFNLAHMKRSRDKIELDFIFIECALF